VHDLQWTGGHLVRRRVKNLPATETGSTEEPMQKTRIPDGHGA
jgi:hypothetical protein